MTRKQSILFFFFLFILVTLGAVLLLRNLPDTKNFGFLEGWRESFLGKESTKYEGAFFVRRAVDGDTIELENGEKVRYIGMNTPESVDPRRPVECFGKEASVFNKNLVEGKTVRLERDVSDRDKYGRLLRFVYLEDGTLVNEVLAREGYAFVSTYPPDVAKQDVFRLAEKQARDEKRGLWNETTCNGKKGAYN